MSRLRRWIITHQGSGNIDGMCLAKTRIALCLLCLVLCCPLAIAAQTSPSPVQALFDFHSGFWINLHHFLYLEAASQKPQPGPRRATVRPSDADVLGSLSPEERSAWDAAVSYYQESVIQRDLLFDEGMNAIKDRLEDAEASSDLGNVDIPAPLRDVLLKATPIYRKHWWATHDADNRAWIARLKPLVEAHGNALRDSLVRIYETPWPGQPVRVDVTVYAGPVGAYTTIEPTRPTISTIDPANQGPAALEILFHETSHGMIRKVADALRAAEGKEKPRVSEPRRSAPLWHAVLFYTAGALVAGRVPGYVPYADKNGLWVRAWPDPDRALIEQDWKPHMNGDVPLSAAIAKLVSDVAAASQH
jgi:hypothetical protein